MQVQVAVDTSSGAIQIIQMAAAAPHQSSLIFSASICKAASTATPSNSTSSHQSAPTLLSKLLHGTGYPAVRVESVLMGSVGWPVAAAQQERAGVMGIEASLQLANLGKLGSDSPAAAATVGPAATWQALQMCPTNAADSLQNVTVGVQIGGRFPGSSWTDHSLQAEHGTTFMQGVVTRPGSAVPHSDLAQLQLPVSGSTPQVLSTTLQSASDQVATMGSLADSMRDVPAMGASRDAGQIDQQAMSESAGLQSRLLAMDAHERKMFIQAQVCSATCLS